MLSTEEGVLEETRFRKSLGVSEWRLWIHQLLRYWWAFRKLGNRLQAASV